MTTLILTSSIVFGLIVAFYNAYVFKLYLTREKSDNNIVHRLGGSLRLFWLVFVGVACWYAKLPWGDIAFYVLVNITLAWTVFDLVYNKIHNHKWYYSGTLGSGTSSVIDKFFNKFDEFIKGGILVLTILWKPFFINEMLEDMITNRGWSVLVVIIIIVVFGYLAIRFNNKKEKD